MLSLQKECTVVTPCVSTKQPPAPVDFPCQMAKAVGIEAHKEDSSTDQETEERNLIALKPAPVKTDWVNWQSCGSALDFLCHGQYEDVKITDPWEASYYTTAIAALMLLVSEKEVVYFFLFMMRHSVFVLIIIYNFHTRQCFQVLMKIP